MKTYFKQHRWPLLVSGLFFLLLVADSIGLLHLPAVETLEQSYYDFRLNQHQPTKQSDQVVIVDIDEKTLAVEGQWPWPRQRFAKLLDQLTNTYQVKLVGLDITFAEPDSHNPLPLLKQLGQTELKENTQFQQTLARLAPMLDPDAQLAESLKHKEIILGYYFSNESTRQFGQIPAPSLSSDLLPAYSLNHLPNFTGYGANLAQLQNVAVGAGHFNPFTDPDGLIRRVPLLEKYNNGLYESLAVRMYRRLQGDPPILPISQSAAGGYEAIEQLLIDDYKIPVDQSLNALVPYRGPARTFTYLSATDVLTGKTPVSQLKNKIVLVGTSSIGLADLRNTPVGNAYPGVEIHANLLAGLLDRHIPFRPTYAIGIELLLLCVLFVTLTIALIRAKAIFAAITAAGIMLILVLTNQWIWQVQLTDLPVIRCLLLVFGLFVIFMTFGFFSETNLKRQLANRFGQYVPPEIVEKMYESPEDYTTEGQNRELSVLFSDVRDFTSLSAHLSPVQLTEVMNLLLSELTEVVREKHLGTIDKYIGDCIMAFWGAPVMDEQHPSHAISAALSMQATMVRLRPEFAKRQLAPLQIGVGINTGQMVVGEMGSRYRTAYTVMGDAVNLAARLEALTKHYGVGILVGEDTYKATKYQFLFRHIGQVIVKGRDEPTSIFEPICEIHAASPVLLKSVELFNQMMQQYSQGEFLAAQQILMQLIEKEPDTLLYLHVEHSIKELIANPPRHWDGITRMKEK